MLPINKFEGKIDAWLELVNAPGPVSDDDLLRMEVILEGLSLLRHAIGPSDAIVTEHDGLDAPRPDQQELRTRISLRFPMLGWYNIPETVTGAPMQSGMVMGDAIDDLLDITNEMLVARWHIEQGRLDEAVWEFIFGYDHHWRYHLRCLLWYMEMRRFEAT